MTEEMAGKLRAVQQDYPDLPALPGNPLYFAGWWQEVKKRVAARSVSKTMAEQTLAMKHLADFWDEVLRAQKTGREIWQTKLGIEQDKELYKIRTELARALIEAELAEALKRAADAAPPVQSETDRIKAETDRIKAQTEFEKAKAEHERVKNQAPRGEPKASPPPESFAERMSREFRRREEAKMRILKEAEELARQYPEHREYIMRQAQKEIDGLMGEK